MLYITFPYKRLLNSSLQSNIIYNKYAIIAKSISIRCLVINHRYRLPRESESKTHSLLYGLAVLVDLIF